MSSGGMDHSISEDRSLREVLLPNVTLARATGKDRADLGSKGSVSKT